MNGVPAIMKDRRSLLPEEIANYLQEYNQAKIADNPDRRRGLVNMMSYTSIDDGMHSEQLKAKMNYEGRSVNSYNFLQMIVRGHLGNVMMNWFDPHFVPRGDDPLDAVEAISKIYYANKEHYNYKQSASRSIENGYVYRGVEELVIDRPVSDPRTWGGKFEVVRSDLIIFDPSNYTDNIHRGSRKCWKIPYITIKDMVRLFPQKKDEILRGMRDEYKKQPEKFQQMNINQFESLDNYMLGSKRQVVEFYHLEHEKVTMQLHRSTGQRLPETPYPINSPDDIAMKVDWALRNGLAFPNGRSFDEMVITVSDFKPVLYLTTFCPAIGLVLDNRKDERQLGHLPFYTWSFMQKNGKSIGLVDFLLDPQNDFNAEENAKKKFRTQTPWGKMWFHPDAFGQDIEKKERAIKEANDVSKPLELDENAPVGVNLFGIMGGMQIPQYIFQDEALKMDVIERLGSLPAAMQGRTGNSAESGIAIGRKVIEGTTMQRSPLENIIQYENDKAEDWLKVNVQILGNEWNENRTFTFNHGKDSITINRFEGWDENGKKVLSADISKIKRTEVIISQTKENDYMKQARREMDVAALQAIGPETPNNAPIHAVFQSQLALNMDYQNDDEKEKVEQAVKLRMELANKQAMVAIMSMDMQLQNMIQGQGQAVGQSAENAMLAGGGGGVPAPTPVTETRGGLPPLPPVRQ